MGYRAEGVSLQNWGLKDNTTRLECDQVLLLECQCFMASVEFICLTCYYEIFNFSVLWVQIQYMKLSYVHGSSDSILVWSIKSFLQVYCQENEWILAGNRYFTELLVNQKESSVDVRLKKGNGLRILCYWAYPQICSRLCRYNLYRYKLCQCFIFLKWLWHSTFCLLQNTVLCLNNPNPQWSSIFLYWNSIEVNSYFIHICFWEIS